MQNNPYGVPSPNSAYYAGSDALVNKANAAISNMLGAYYWWNGQGVTLQDYRPGAIEYAKSETEVLREEVDALKTIVAGLYEQFVPAQEEKRVILP